MYPSERAKNTKSFNNKTYLINICPTIKHKYDVSLPLQLIHVCALKTTELIYHFLSFQ